jgi:hypothetical protein
MELLICDFVGQEEVRNFRAQPPQAVYSCSTLRVTYICEWLYSPLLDLSLDGGSARRKAATCT